MCVGSASPTFSSKQLQHTATHCNALQHTAAHCNTLQHTFLKSTSPMFSSKSIATRCNTLQHAATPYNTLQHTATLCNALEVFMCYYALQCVVCCRVHCAAGCCSALRRVYALLRMYMSDITDSYVWHLACDVTHLYACGVLQCADLTVRCSVLCVAECAVLQHVAVCCSVLEHVGACRSMLERVAVCYSMLHCKKRATNGLFFLLHFM